MWNIFVFFFSIALLFLCFHEARCAWLCVIHRCHGLGLGGPRCLVGSCTLNLSFWLIQPGTGSWMVSLDSLSDPGHASWPHLDTLCAFIFKKKKKNKERGKSMFWEFRQLYNGWIGVSSDLLWYYCMLYAQAPNHGLSKPYQSVASPGAARSSLVEGVRSVVSFWLCLSRKCASLDSIMAELISSWSYDPYCHLVLLIILFSLLLHLLVFSCLFLFSLPV